MNDQVTESKPAPRVGWWRGPLWAVGGFVMASVIWAAALIVADSFQPAPRYRFTADLCAAIDFTLFSQTGLRKAESMRPRNPDGGITNPYPDSFRHAGTDWMKCTVRLVPTTEIPAAEALLEVSVQLYKHTDPRPEVLADSEIQVTSRPGQQSPAQVTGVGEFAQVMAADRDSQARSWLDGFDGRLAGYDGWTTFRATWRESINEEHAQPLAGSAQISELLQATMKTALERLRR